MPKETFYFSHDYNTRSDIKIKRLISKLGMLGYGVFWSIIEDLYNNANALPTDYESISFDLHCDQKIVESVVNDFELFQIQEGYFGSISVQKRLEDRDAKSQKASESARKRWDKCERIPNALPPLSEPNAIKERKGNENKEKDIDIKFEITPQGIIEETPKLLPSKKEKPKFIPPTLDEVKNYFIEKGYKVDAAVKAFNYYEAADWKDSNGKPVLSWKQKLNGVWFKPENKANPNEQTEVDNPEKYEGYNHNLHASNKYTHKLDEDNRWDYKLKFA